MLKILLITTRTRGGAGIACRRLWEHLSKADQVELVSLCFMQKADLSLVSYGKSSGKSEEVLYKDESQYPNERRSQFLNENETGFSGTYKSALEDSLAHDEALIKILERYDLINLHWASGLLSVKTIRHLGNINQPVLITLHDANYFTGGCHYPSGCNQFADTCLRCPQLKTQAARDIARNQHETKRILFSRPNIYWTGPSDWIVSQVARSGMPYSPKNIVQSVKNITAEFDSPDNTFMDSLVSKLRLDSIHIAIAADNLDDKRKGLELGVRALSKALSERGQGSRITLHLIGSRTDELESLVNCLAKEVSSSAHKKEVVAQNVMWHNKLTPPEMEAMLKHIDILIFPSLEENYSNLIIEALQASTAVIAFPVGGNKEIASCYPKLMRLVNTYINTTDGINSNSCQIVRGLTERMKTAIIECLDNKSWHSTCEAKQCQEDHSPSVVISEYLGIVDKILAACKLRCTTKDQLNEGQADITQTRNISMLRSPIDKCHEKVAWTSLEELLEYVSHGSCCLSREINLLALRPSWDSSFISDRMLPAFALNERLITTHDQIQPSYMNWWDLVFVEAKLAEPFTVNTNKPTPLENPMEGSSIALLLAWTSKDRVQSILSASDAIWSALLGHIVLMPTAGIYEYTSRSMGVNDIHATEDCLAKLAEMSKREQPVYWLTSNFTFNFNPQTEINDSYLVLATHYPSWEEGYLRNRINPRIEYKTLIEVSHNNKGIKELEYWNTAVICIPLSGLAGHRLSADAIQTDELIPISYLGIGTSKDIKYVQGQTAVIEHLAGLLSNCLTEVIEPKNAFRSVFQ